MKVVILAGGFGTRLAEETDQVPKPMVEIGGRPILWHILKHYGCYGLNDFVICLGYKGHVIKDYFNNYLLRSNDVIIDLAQRSMAMLGESSEPWRIALLDTGLSTMTGGRLKRVASQLGKEAFCMTYGDAVGRVDIQALRAFHATHGRLATVTVHRLPSRFGVIELEGDRVTAVREKSEDDGTLINIGYCILEPGVFDYIDGDSTPWEQGPLQRLAADGQLMAYRHEGFWHPMDTLRDRRSLEDLWRSEAAPWKVW